MLKPSRMRFFYLLNVKEFSFSGTNVCFHNYRAFKRPSCVFLDVWDVFPPELCKPSRSLHLNEVDLQFPHCSSDLLHTRPLPLGLRVMKNVPTHHGLWNPSTQVVIYLLKRSLLQGFLSASNENVQPLPLCQVC